MTPRQRAYPATRYKPPAVIDLSSRKERERLSASGLKAFFNIMARWRVRDEDAHQRAERAVLAPPQPAHELDVALTQDPDQLAAVQDR